MSLLDKAKSVMAGQEKRQVCYECNELIQLSPKVQRQLTEILKASPLFRSALEHGARVIDIREDDELTQGTLIE